jgi:heme/copper-type cytochrome/quinol oxidase subunit 2
MGDDAWKDRGGRMARWRWLLACLLISGGVLAGCGGGDDGAGAAGAITTVASTTTTTGAEPTSTEEPTTTTAGFSGTVIEAKVTGDQVETASRRVRVSRGEKVRIQVEADHAEEVHVHGYDLKKDVAPGRPAVIDFTADAPGVFEVELEEAALRLFELQVQ